MRLRGGRAARVVPQESHLALLPIRLLQPATPPVAAVQALRGGLAGHPPARARGPRAATPGPGAPVRLPAPVLPGPDERPRPRAHRAGHRALCRNTDQDLEQRPDRASAAGTGEAADG